MKPKTKKKIQKKQTARGSFFARVKCWYKGKHRWSQPRKNKSGTKATKWCLDCTAKETVRIGPTLPPTLPSTQKMRAVRSPLHGTITGRGGEGLPT